MRPPINRFVFIIGFNRTGTKSLHNLFKLNGFASIHFDRGRLASTMLKNCLEDRPVLHGYDRRYRVFSDLIIETTRIRFEANGLFRALDKDYPESFFVYNTRNMDDWLASRSNHYIPKYQCTVLDLEQRRNGMARTEILEQWRRERTDFEAAIRDYFSNTGRLLELDISSATVPETLATFLGIRLDPQFWTRSHSSAVPSA